MRVSVQLQPQHATWEHMRAAWIEADGLGADVIFTWDHFYPLTGEPEGLHFEALTTMAAMAECTERAEIGALVICNSYRNPEYLADAHRTLDHASGGRAVLGIGAGWFEKDYDEYGYAFGTKGSRISDLEAALPRIEARMEKLNPPPVRGRLPILIGGGGPKRTLKLVARHADIWHAFGTVEVFREKDAILREHCAAEDRNSDDIERSWAVGSGGDDPDALREAGVQHLILGIGGSPSGYDLGPLRELLQWRDGLG